MLYLDKVRSDEDLFERLKKISGVSLIQDFVGYFLGRQVKVEYEQAGRTIDKGIGTLDGIYPQPYKHSVYEIRIKGGLPGGGEATWGIIFYPMRIKNAELTSKGVRFFDDALRRATILTLE
jgi:hypothetical protein